MVSGDGAHAELLYKDNLAQTTSVLVIRLIRHAKSLTIEQIRHQGLFTTSTPDPSDFTVFRVFDCLICLSIEF